MLLSKSSEDEQQEKSELDLLLHALNHPLRRRIIRALIVENASAKVLAGSFGAKAPSVSYHLNQVLAKECGVVRVVDTIQRRGGIEKIYAIREKRLWVPFLWEGLPATVGDGLRQFSLREFLAHTLAVIAQDGAAVLTWQAIEVDERGWEEILVAADRFRLAVNSAVDRTLQEDAKGTASRIKGITGISAYRPASIAAVEAWAKALGRDC